MSHVFRSKVTIEAIRWNGDNWPEVREWARARGSTIAFRVESSGAQPVIDVGSFDGPASVGDWIVASGGLGLNVKTDEDLREHFEELPPPGGHPVTVPNADGAPVDVRDITDPRPLPDELADDTIEAFYISDQALDSWAKLAEVEVRVLGRVGTLGRALGTLVDAYRSARETLRDGVKRGASMYVVEDGQITGILGDRGGLARLARFLIDEFPGEPSRPSDEEGAVDTAIRLLRTIPRSGSKPGQTGAPTKEGE